MGISVTYCTDDYDSLCFGPQLWPQVRYGGISLIVPGDRYRGHGRLHLGYLFPNQVILQ